MSVDKLFSLGDIPSLLQRYATGELIPSEMVDALHALVQNDASNAWIYKLPLESLRRFARSLEAGPGTC